MRHGVFVAARFMAAAVAAVILVLPSRAETIKTNQGVLFDVPSGWRVDAGYRGGGAKLVHGQTGYLMFVAGRDAGKAAKITYQRKEPLPGGRVLEWLFADAARNAGFSHYLGHVLIGRISIAMTVHAADFRSAVPESLAVPAMRHVAETACRTVAC